MGLMGGSDRILQTVKTTRAPALLIRIQCCLPEITYFGSISESEHPLTKA